MKRNKKKAENEYVLSPKFGKANWLTVIRLLLMIPFIAIMSVIFAFKTKGENFFYEGILLKGSAHALLISILYWVNIIIFIGAMITDLADGIVARKTNTVSAFGKIFDPIADKVSTTLMLLFLAILDFSYLPIVVLFIVRDILVDGSRVYASKKNIKIAANIWGKLKTMTVFIAILIIGFSAPWLINAKDKDGNPNTLLLFYVNIPLIVGLLISWISGVFYMVKYLKGIKNDLSKELEKEQSLKITKEFTLAEMNDPNQDIHLSQDELNTFSTTLENIDQKREEEIDFSKTDIFE